MSEPSGSKRRYTRQRVSIDCQVDGASGRASMRLSELGLGGCFVDTRMEFSPGTPVTVRAAFPSGELVFKGRVIYILSGYGFGLAFEELTPEMQQALESILPAG